MSGLVDVWRGSVRQTECDELGHMNVRHYFDRSHEGVAGLALSFGFGPRRLDALQRCFVVREHHVRFHRELLAGTPCVLRSGVLGFEGERLRVYQELRRLTDEKVSATFQLEIEFAKENGWRGEPLTGELRARASNQLVSLPSRASARGLALDPPRVRPTMAEADDLGLVESYRGVVTRMQTDLMCRMRPAELMGVVTHGGPHLFRLTAGLETQPGSGFGTAALEYRLVYRNTALLGDVLVMRSGLKGILGEKTLGYCHWLFHAETGECLLTTEGIAAFMDLRERRAVTIPEAARERIEERALSSLTP